MRGLRETRAPGSPLWGLRKGMTLKLNQGEWYQAPLRGGSLRPAGSSVFP